MIQIDDKIIEQTRALLRGVPDGTVKALSMGLNRAAAGAKVDAARRASEKYYVSKRMVAASIYIGKASSVKLMAFVQSIGRNRGLINFNAIPKAFPARRMKKRPAVAVKRGAPRVRLPYSFVAKVRGDHVGLFTRPGGKTANGKDKLDQLYGPSLPTLISVPSVRGYVEERAAVRMEKEITKAANYLLRK